MVVPGLKDVVQGSTCAMSSRPRVSACSSFFCFPDEPRNIRGLSIRLLQPSRSGTTSACQLLVWPSSGCPRDSVRGGPHSLQRMQRMPAAIFRSGAERNCKNSSARAVMPTVSSNAAAMVFDGAESDAPALRRHARVLAARPVVAFYRRPGAPYGCFCLIWVTGCGGWVILHCTMRAFAHGAAANRH